MSVDWEPKRSYLLLVVDRILLLTSILRVFQYTRWGLWVPQDRTREETPETFPDRFYEARARAPGQTAQREGRSCEPPRGFSSAWPPVSARVEQTGFPEKASFGKRRLSKFSASASGDLLFQLRCWWTVRSRPPRRSAGGQTWVRRCGSIVQGRQ